jgi:signal transduction histidine kinase
MSVTDNGIGLPENYMEQGHGIKNMIADAERVGGKLDVISDGSVTSICCRVPYDQVAGGR